MSWQEYVTQFGIYGRLEAGRQALEEADEKGLSFGELCTACGVGDEVSSRTTILMQLTRYCAIYEEQRTLQSKIRYFLNREMDEDFDRHVLPYDISSGRIDEEEWNDETAEVSRDDQG